MADRTIPVYSCQNELQRFVTPERAQQLEAQGFARVVRHRKGVINRVIMYRGRDEPRPMKVEDYVGTPYSHRQHLADGHTCWCLRALGDKPSETDLAPEEVRPIFLRVLINCLASSGLPAS